MKTTLKLIKILAVLWVVLAGMLSGVPGIAFCIGSDGHIGLELSHQGRCSSDGDIPNSRHHPTLELLANPFSDCCGDCVDVSFSFENMPPFVKEVKNECPYQNTIILSLGISWITADVDHMESACVAALRARPPTLSSFLLTQRTVVLRI